MLFVVILDFDKQAKKETKQDKSDQKQNKHRNSFPETTKLMWQDRTANCSIKIGHEPRNNFQATKYLGYLPFDRKIRLGCEKHNGKRFFNLPPEMPHPLRFESKKRRICVAWVWNREGTEKLVNGKQHSVWSVPTEMKALPQNVLLNFRLEFPESDLTINLPSGIYEFFSQMVSTLSLHQKKKLLAGGLPIVH